MAPVAGIVGAIALGVVFVALRDRWQRWWFELEDPRPLAWFRIVFCVLLLGDVASLHRWFDFLFEPNGLFTAAEARSIWGARGDRLLDAVVGFVSGRFSILYYWDHPRSFELVLGAFVGSAVLFMVGFRTRVTGVLTLLLLDSVLMRNRVFWEGTEAVFRVWLVYLVCSRCGETTSVDAWLRRRRGDTRAPALVPAWPRRLMMVQLGILMLTTGLLKHEGAWVEGDAVYYALTYEHYARFRMESVFAHVGPAWLAVITVVARSVEVFFCFVLVGIVGRWVRSRFAPLEGRRRLVVHAALLVALAGTTAIVLETGKPRLLPVESAPLAAAVLVVVCVGVFVVWTRERAASLRRIFARRLWLMAAALLFCGMWLLMNIGFFHPVMLATLIPFLGTEPPPSTSLAYSSRTRAVLGVLLAVHLLAIAVTVVPARSVADVVTRRWMWATRTEQGWGMWADVPRENEFLKAVAIDDSGREIDLHTDMYAEELRPPSRWSYDRRWKIAERIVRARGGSRYPGAYARWLCREREGVSRIELYSVTVPIPTPEENRELGGYDPGEILRTRALERILLDHACE